MYEVYPKDWHDVHLLQVIVSLYAWAPLLEVLFPVINNLTHYKNLAEKQVLKTEETIVLLYRCLHEWVLQIFSAIP